MINFEELTFHLDLNKKIYVAYSGGPDSSALLYLLHQNNINNFEAIHINHNLSKNAFQWQSHCEQVCESLKVKLHVESIEITPEGDGLESAARKARYDIFSKYLNFNEQILLGHHSNDVAETFLLRLFRGTGVDGLDGLAVKRKVGEGYLVRPLIKFSKDQILDYLKSNNIKYINDESNFELEQDRNYIRNTIIPAIENRWNKASSRIAKTSGFVKDRNSSYEYLFNTKFQSLISNKIKVKELKKLDEVFIIDILRMSLKNLGIAMPSKKIIDEIIKTFIKSNPGPKSEVSWTRADNDQPGGHICYRDKSIVISKK